ncbi:flagellar basal body P-ring formation chaperone FlgA [Mitsuaria sp. WAJ17]|uniref:flagellar basal body P-ring formation chaperone FlgA n=1 Tax=Mitsuaria sp. WAJ17 TaxID=2761452 RepID=UPI0028732181|nr:flagellar basal body P-ring formation chaperone FlgA [Mitsuaria sp. WAJ17]
MALLPGLCCAPWAQAQSQGLEPWRQALQQTAEQAASQLNREFGASARVMVELGQADPRLRLAPCQRAEPYLLPGMKLWGRSRIGLRCVEGTSRWNVSLPLTVHVFAPALVAAGPLDNGTTLSAEHLRLAEVDIAADQGGVFTDMAALLGRSLARPVQAGEALRSGSLKQRQWFAAGTQVKVTARGAGFAIAGEGQALGQGLDGQDVRVRFENGRTVTGRAVGEREVEVLL